MCAAAVVGAVAAVVGAADVAGTVVELEADDFFPPVDALMRMAMMATTATTASPPTMARRRLERRCWAARLAAARAAAFSRWRWRLSLGTGARYRSGRSASMRLS